jgi:pSer/pThr/pTyr-binding forkhead associated (FHA) protein
MGKLVISMDGVVIKEVQITKEKTTLGRRPYNDVVIDNLAVSGEHAALLLVGAARAVRGGVMPMNIGGI